jgi:DNA protecting protein DprA
MSAEEIKAQFKMPINVAKAIASVSLTVVEEPELKQLEVNPLTIKGIKVLSRDSSDYPKRLGEVLGNKAPPTLYYWGNLDLLNGPSVGFCGSREASDKGIAVAADVAKQVVALGWVVVSGHARGVDTTAHRTALENGGSTIIVAPEGLLTFKLRAELKRIAKPEHILIISEFAPEARWTVYHAMTRNRTIIGLSDAMVLVESRTEGGTFEAGNTTLRLKTPLFVVEYRINTHSSGNTYFLQQGAIALHKSKETGKANIDQLRATVNRKLNSTDKTILDKVPEQLSLLPQ